MTRKNHPAYKEVPMASDDFGNALAGLFGAVCGAVTVAALMDDSPRYVYTPPPRYIPPPPPPRVYVTTRYLPPSRNPAMEIAYSDVPEYAINQNCGDCRHRKCGGDCPLVPGRRGLYDPACRYFR